MELNPYMQTITKSIEEEVERRVTERMTSLLEYMSEACDIPMKVLTKIMLKVETKQTVCLGLNKKTNKRCRNSPKDNGYCHLHQSQYTPKLIDIQPKIVHTHTLPPLYMKGCPACEATSSKQIDMGDLFLC
jgi:hypothetical protein